MSIKTNHKAAADSINIRNTKFFPAIYGKSIDGVINRGKNGIK